MVRNYYNELIINFTNIKNHYIISDKKIFVFGHCNITEKLIDLIMLNGFSVNAILDNNKNKYDLSYKGIPVIPPEKILEENHIDTIVFVAVNYYAAMRSQLIAIGYIGKIFNLIDYNSYSEYSLSNYIIKKKTDRCNFGIEILNNIKKHFSNCFIIFCPYTSIGDIYLCLAYLPFFLKKKKLDNCVICTQTQNGKLIAEMFGFSNICVLDEYELEVSIQAAVFLQDSDVFISHTDKPYFIKLVSALHIKLIPFETLYSSGVYGLSKNIVPYEPVNWKTYSNINKIPKKKSVIISPYASSVTLLPNMIWEKIIIACQKIGYSVFTNVANKETPLKGTIGISPAINEMKSVVEYAGTFIGLRSGLCDILRSAECHKIALFPDYYFSSTKWKSIDVFKIDGFQNIEVKDDIDWNSIL